MTNNNFTRTASKMGVENFKINYYQENVIIIYITIENWKNDFF